MMYIKKIVPVVPFLLLASCASTNQEIAYNATSPVNSIQKYNNCYNSSIVISKSIPDTRRIVKKSVQNLDAVVSKDSENQFVIKRKHHIGLVVGSGGETITFNYKKVDDKKTLITMDTTRDLVGVVGQKAWSCEIAETIQRQVAR